MSTPKSLLVRLILSSDKLAKFPRSDGAITAVPPTVKLHGSSDKSSDSTVATPVPNGDSEDPNSLAPPKPESKPKKSGSSSGKKRAPPSIDPNGPMKERSRPGPKKKQKLNDGSADKDGGDNGKPSSNIPAHKLGPKANTGAINAGLRALDRSGKPCRKWERKGLNIKSFTGASWGMSSWKAPLRDTFSGDVKSDSSATPGSDIKLNNESSVVPSERSHADGGDTTMINGIDSSPAPTAIAA